MKKIIRIRNTAIVAGTGLALVAFATLATTSKARAATSTTSSLQNTVLTQDQMERLAIRYSFVDPDGMVPSDLLMRALAFFDANKSKLGNRESLAVVNSSHLEKTLYVVNMQSGHVHGYDLGDSTQSLAGYYLANEAVSNHRLDVKINAIQSGRVSSTSALLRGLATAELETVARALQGGSLLFAGQAEEEDQVMQATATSSTSTYTVQTPPLWEAKRKTDGRAWTLFAFDVVKNYGTSLMAGTSDIRTFCPSYSKLTQNQKLNFWVYLVSAVVKYESAFNPLSRYHESTMGIDPITKKPVYSEGLLQLSYQDIQGYPFCEFNWSVDKYLSPTDPKKTILDPYKNLKCGIRILNQIVKKKNLIAFNTGHYWSTLKPKYSPEKSIVALTNTIPFCKR